MKNNLEIAGSISQRCISVTTLPILQMFSFPVKMYVQYMRYVKGFIALYKVVSNK